MSDPRLLPAAALGVFLLLAGFAAGHLVATSNVEQAARIAYADQAAAAEFDRQLAELVEHQDEPMRLACEKIIEIAVAANEQERLLKADDLLTLLPPNR